MTIGDGVDKSKRSTVGGYNHAKDQGISETVIRVRRRRQGKRNGNLWSKEGKACWR